MSFLTIQQYRTPSRRHSHRARHFLVWMCIFIIPVAVIAGWLLLDYKHTATQAATGIPNLITYQGKVADSTGTAITNGDYNFLFQIYSASTGGTALWTESWTATTTAGAVDVINGTFSVALGTSTSLSTLDFNQDSLYLQISFDADSNGSFEETFSPRKQLTSAPYSFNSDKLDGLTSSDFLSTTTYSAPSIGSIGSSSATTTAAGNFIVTGATKLASSLTGILKATAGYVATALVDLASDVTGILDESNIDSDIARDSELHSPVTLSGALDYITLSGQQIVRGAIDLATDITGILAISNGGTGTSTAPSYGQLLVGNGSGGYNLIATSSLGISGGSSQWSDSGSDIYFDTGNIAVGTTPSASTKLQIYQDLGDTAQGYGVNMILEDNEGAFIQGILGAKVEAGSILAENTYIGTVGSASISSTTASAIGVLGIATGGMNNYAGYFVGNVEVTSGYVSSTSFCLNSDCISSWTGGGDSIWEYGTNYDNTVITTSSTMPVWFKGTVYSSSSFAIAPSSGVGISVDATNVPVGIVSQINTQNGGQFGVASIMDGTTLGALSYYATGLFTAGDEYNVGLYGTSFKATSTAGNIGVYASAANSGAGNIAGLFETANSDYTAWLGLDGSFAVGGSAGSSTNPLNIGVYGQAHNGPGRNWAGYFESNVYIEDHLTIGTSTVDQYPLFIQDNSSTTATTTMNFTSYEFLGGTVKGPVIEGTASNGANGLATVRDFAILGGTSFNPQFILQSRDLLQSANIGYATSTDAMSFRQALGGYVFETAGNANTSITIKEQDVSGGLLPDIKFPVLYGSTLNSTIGALEAVGINNNLLIIEDSSLYINPLLSFGAADFGDTGNSGNIAYVTSTQQFNIDKQIVIQDTNDDPRITFMTDNSATSSEIFLTSDDSLFFSGATGGNFFDNSVAVLNDNYPSYVLGSADGSNIAAISYQSSTDVMSFTQALGGYSFDNLSAVGSDPLCWDGSGESLIGDCTSLGKYKANRQDLDIGLQEILQLQPRTFEWKRHNDGTLAINDPDFYVADIGFIAEEVEAVSPWFGKYDYDTGQLTGIRERGILAANVNATKELYTIVSDTSDNLALLSQQVSDLSVSINSSGGQQFNVGQATTFYGTITVIGEANFQSKVVFSEHVYFNQDSAGTLIIEEGQSSTTVMFSDVYEYAPIIAVTPREDVSGYSYWIEDQGVDGFVLMLDNEAGENLEFNWHAVATTAGEQNTVIPEPEPTPGPVPTPESLPEPDPTPDSTPEPDPTPDPDPAPTPEPEPAPTPEPEPTPTPAPDPTPPPPVE